MVTVYITLKGPMKLQIMGHANAAEPGKDLVCCALSIIAQSLSMYLYDLENAGLLKESINSVMPGNTFIEVVASEYGDQLVRAAFAMARAGLRAMAEDYPENISMKEE